MLRATANRCQSYSGVLVATLVNHAGAGGIGTLLSGVFNPTVLNWAVVASFGLMAGWILIPDKLDQGKIAMPKRAIGVFGTTAFTFFIAEMGDKTQIVTIALLHDTIIFLGL